MNSFSAGPRRCLQAIAGTSQPPALTSLLFLLPAFQRPFSSRQSFSTSSTRTSKIGQMPLSLPPDVNLRLLEKPRPKSDRLARNQAGTIVEVEGPLGKLSMSIPSYLHIEQDEATRKAVLRVEDKEIREQREMWGTTRACLANHILGVSEGHIVILRLVGVGYRASVESTAVTKSPEYEGQHFVSLRVGYSHPIELGLPVGVKASTPQPTRILLEGPEKRIVKQFAAEIRAWRKPEPYKGKGIFVDDETIRLKAKKIK